jgi:CRISPR/Cas system-associated exonuclease Cas4 (RecB family)
LNSDIKTYSWSRLNSYYQAEIGEGCFYGFDLQYNQGDRGESNFFAEYGTLVHETIEKIHNQELLVWDVEDELKRGLNSFTFQAPFEHMKRSYETSLFKFFEEFDDVFKNYKILEAEEKKLFQVDDIWLVGYPDMIAEHTEHGLVIGDYKSAKVYTGDKLNHNIMQLYLYSIPVFEKYGRYPDHLIYIYPREKVQREYVYKFDLDKLEQTKEFVRQTVKKIENHQGEYKPRCKEVDGSTDFYACFLCNHRRNCPHRFHVTNSNPFGEAI